MRKPFRAGRDPMTCEGIDRMTERRHHPIKPKA
jgi:hypothetical protein